jgi:Na+/melibiose symporter-like transporter
MARGTRLTPHQRQAAEHAAERAIGNGLTLVLAVACVVQLVRGESASPYAQLLLAAGVIWGVTLLVARRRAAAGS